MTISGVFISQKYETTSGESPSKVLDTKIGDASLIIKVDKVRSNIDFYDQFKEEYRILKTIDKFPIKIIEDYLRPAKFITKYGLCLKNPFILENLQDLFILEALTDGSNTTSSDFPHPTSLYSHELRNLASKMFWIGSNLDEKTLNSYLDLSKHRFPFSSEVILNMLKKFASHKNNVSKLTVLMFAARFSKVDDLSKIVKILLKHKPESCLETSLEGDNALLVAETPECITQLLDAGADINYCTKENGTTLFHSLKNDDLQIIRTLIAKKANLYKGNFEGESPLTRAFEGGKLEHANILIDSGIDVKVPDGRGITPITAACSYARVHNYEIIKKLFDAGAKLSSENINSTLLSTYIDNPVIIKLLIEKGANPGYENLFGETPLINAISKNKKDHISILIKAKADINYINKKQFSPLMHAVMSNNLEIVLLLIQLGANVNLKNKNNESAISMARSQGYTEIVKILLDASIQQYFQKTAGCITSPFYFAVIALGNLEKSSTSISQKIDTLEYADDFIRFAKTKEMLEQEESMTISLTKCGLGLSLGKTQMIIKLRPKTIKLKTYV